VGGDQIEGGNPIRTESIEQAVRLDAKLRTLWARHPLFVLVPHNRSFFKKISFGLASLESIVSQLSGAKPPARRGKRKVPAKPRR
jgi:hypothetical protein